ncbi:glutathione S-transferase family protein [Paraburkholderia agricolaris]|uniref:glutathione S-transferase family protein n=1 Tax=Paraburkholderia agricolaris TaxID=2152888 RepID=UPI001292980E|nr:glutathione S-transferase N-terminal domain-containing protein [Paraburkholderia agricolaris]
MQQAASTVFPPKLTLYYSPKACSLASHIALEESRLPYEAVSVDIRAGENVGPDYLKINPGGIVPALVAGDAVITESQAILAYIADLAPESGLIPRPGTRVRAKAHEWMNWISSSLHVTYRSIFRPQAYAGESPDAIAAVREHAGKKLAKMLVEIERRLGDAPYGLGEDFSVVDAYLFVFYLWSFDERIQAELPERPRYAALAARVWARDAVRVAVTRERAVRAYELPPQFASDPVTEE